MEKHDSTNSEYILEVQKLSVGYHAVSILDSIDLGVKRGELLAIVGPNGCGKTSLLHTACGFLKPVKGNVLLNGTDIRHYSMLQRANILAFLGQKTQISWPFTVRELVSQGRFAHTRWFGSETAEDNAAIQNALELCRLDAMQDTVLTELSGGEVQRVLIARSLAQQPKLLVLDEPVTHLDARYQIEAMDLIKKQTENGIGAMISLHDLNLAALYADRITLFSEESLLATGSVETVFKDELLSEAFGTPLMVGAHPRDKNIKTVYHA